MRGSDHRHGHRLDRRHEPVANREDIALLIERAILHLFEIVAARKSPPRALQNDGAHLRPRRLALELGGQLGHEPGRKRVERQRAIEGDDRGGWSVFNQEVFERFRHANLLARFSLECPEWKSGSTVTVSAAAL